MRRGDVGFDFINGRNDQAGMVCGISCGFNGRPTTRGGWRSGFQLAAKAPERRADQIPNWW